jgi:hypothetical protein
MQGFVALPDKMHSMFSLQSNFSSQSSRVFRWLVAVWIALALMGNVLAQSAAPKVDLKEKSQGAGSSVQVKQTLWIDDSRQLDFESARTQEFKPFNPFERLSFGNKVAWLRLQIEQADVNSGPLLMH